jgi:hypothetical protein
MEPRSVMLPDGRALVVREVRPDDAAGLDALFSGLSFDDQYKRFFGAARPPKRFVSKMAKVNARGGFGIVAVSSGDGAVVGEASYTLLSSGDGELGITVADGWRGWLGPYLLSVLKEQAAARGVRNLEAEVLVVNKPMLSLVRRRPYAIVNRPDWTVVRVAMGTATATPLWPTAEGGHPRVLVEAASGWWAGTEAARAAGVDVRVCPGPSKGRRCPALTGEACPLAAEADVVVDGLADPALVAAHRALHPRAVLCTDTSAAAAPAALDAAANAHRSRQQNTISS